MYLKPILVALLALLFVFPAAAQTRKYDIKSGVVTYDRTMTVSTLTIKQRIVVSFDDYGVKECREIWSEGQLIDIYFSDGKDLIAVKPLKKTASVQGKSSRGTELRVDWTDFGTERDRQTGKIKRLPTQVVAGKTCRVFESDDGKGSVTRYAGWNKIMLLLDARSKNSHTVQIAIKVEENVPVLADKFKVPAGFLMR